MPILPALFLNPDQARWRLHRLSLLLGFVLLVGGIYFYYGLKYASWSSNNASSSKHNLNPTSWPQRTKWASLLRLNRQSFNQLLNSNQLMTPQSLPKHLLNRLANCRLAGILLLGLLLAQPLLTQAPTIRYVRDGASGDLQAMVSVSAANA